MSTNNRDDHITPLINDEIFHLVKSFTATVDKIQKYMAEHPNPNTSEKTEVADSYFDLVKILAFYLENAVQLTIEDLNIDRNIIEQAIEDAKMNMDLAHKKDVAKRDLQQQIDDQKKQGNNKLADVLAEELANLEKQDSKEGCFDIHEHHCE
jgi:hypothetical protein